MFGLSGVIAPVEEQTFLNENWNKKALLVQGAADKFQDLFGWKEVNYFLSNSRRGKSEVRLIYEKKEFPVANLENSDEWLRKGATLAINSVSHVDGVVGKFCSLLGRDLNTFVNTNCYASFTSKQGFNIHYDEHDVFIIQVEGRKRWAVFEPTYAHPLHLQGITDKGEPPTSDPYIEFELTKGDVLYIPRGHWHYAVATTPSVHLTVGPQSRSPVEYMNWLCQQLVQDEFFRQDLPVAGSETFSGPVRRSVLDEHVDKFRQRMLDLFSDKDKLLESIVQYVMMNNPSRREWNLPVDWEDDMIAQPNQRFRLHEEQKVLLRYDEDNLNAVVFARGNRVNLEGVPKAMLSIIFDDARRSFSINDILAEVDLKKEAVSNAVTTLYRMRIIDIAQKTSET